MRGRSGRRSAAIVAALLAVSTLAGAAPTAHAGVPPFCTPDMLRGRFDLTGAAGSLVGQIVVKNASYSECTVKGRPRLIPVNANGEAYPVEQNSVPPYWRSLGQPPPPGWPNVVLVPDGRAWVRFAWANWCFMNPPDRWRMVLPWGGARRIPAIDSTPPCNQPGAKSMVWVGPFEPPNPAPTH